LSARSAHTGEPRLHRDAERARAFAIDLRLVGAPEVRQVLDRDLGDRAAADLVVLDVRGEPALEGRFDDLERSLRMRLERAVVCSARIWQDLRNCLGDRFFAAVVRPAANPPLYQLIGALAEIRRVLNAEGKEPVVLVVAARLPDADDFVRGVLADELVLRGPAFGLQIVAVVGDAPAYAVTSGDEAWRTVRRLRSQRFSLKKKQPPVRCFTEWGPLAQSFDFGYLLRQAQE
jgi:hypothetical protein